MCPATPGRLFEINGVKFGVAICHEGWRYPETVRWAAVRGAKIVFHPQHTGSDKQGVRPTQWGAADGPYYEKAMMMRSRENTIYFASVNYALRFQESATSLIAPSGQCQAYLPYGQEGVLVQAINVEEATGLLAIGMHPSVINRNVKIKDERLGTGDYCRLFFARPAKITDKGIEIRVILRLYGRHSQRSDSGKIAPPCWPLCAPVPGAKVWS